MSGMRTPWPPPRPIWKVRLAACQTSYLETVQKVAAMLEGKVSVPPINVDAQTTEADGENLQAPPSNVPPTATEAFAELQDLVNGKFTTALPAAVRAKLLEQFHVTLKGSFETVGDGDAKPEVPAVEATPATQVPAPVDPKSMEPPAATEARLGAVAAEFQRKDTSQMASDEDHVMVDGVVMYRTAKGKLETLEQRNKRLAHNLYVKFSRSFDGVLVAV